jgi:PEGA domain
LPPTVVEAARPGDCLEVFACEETAVEESLAAPQPEALPIAAPIDAPPPIETPAPIETRARLGWRRYQLPRLEISRFDAVRFSGFFALGLLAGVFIAWITSESPTPVPSAGVTPPPTASATTGASPSELSPRLPPDMPAASVGHVPNAGASLQSARAPARVRQTAAVPSGRPVSPVPERRSAPRTRPAPQRTENVATARAAETPNRPRGSLTIDSDPQGAHVSFNGRTVGSTPVRLDRVPAGTHLVRIQADGYQVWAWTTRVVANQKNRLTVKLFSSANQ